MLTKKLSSYLFGLVGLMLLSQNVFAGITQAPPYYAYITNTNLPLYLAHKTWTSNVYKINWSVEGSGLATNGEGALEMGTNYDTSLSSNNATVNAYFILPTTGYLACTSSGTMDEENCAGCVVTIYCEGLQTDGSCKKLRASAENYGSWSGVCGRTVEQSNVSMITYIMG